MKLIETFKNFASNESGAVTVDWVVLTAAIVGLGIAVVASVSGGVRDLGSSISTALTGVDIELDAHEGEGGTGLPGS